MRPGPACDFVILVKIIRMKNILFLLMLFSVFVMRAQSSQEVSGNTGLLGSSGVYPNPSAGIAYLDVDSDHEVKQAKLSVTNLLGEVIYSKGVDLSKGKNVLSFERDQLAPGIYLVTLSSGTEHITRRFTVSR
jgi:hypothetical protein